MASVRVIKKMVRTVVEVKPDHMLAMSCNEAG